MFSISVQGFPFVTISKFLHNVFPLNDMSPGDMAPRLSPSKLVLIRDMIESESFTSETAGHQYPQHATIWKLIRTTTQTSRTKTNCDALDDRSPL